MKLTLYAEKNNGILFALPDPNAEDTVKNGWLFNTPDNAEGKYSGNILDAKCENNKLFIIPKNFGKEKFYINKNEFEVEILPVIENGKYSYKNLPIGGGGYVTGFCFDDDGWLFCRTDIGGCYSCKPPYEQWQALSHNACYDTEWLCTPLSITSKNNELYVLFGNNSGSYLGISSDKGKTFTFHSVPAYVHGNCAGRSTGERIAVTSDKIFIGTRGNGLLCAELKDTQLSWTKMKLTENPCSKLLMYLGHDNPKAEVSAFDDITFVRSDSDDIIIAGTAENCGIFISYDKGVSFDPLPSQPEPDNKNNPFISQRTAVYEDYLFITYSATMSDRNSLWYSYACDGSKIYDGRIYRYQLKNGRYAFSADITPINCTKSGFSGIDVSSDGKFLVCTTVCSFPDSIYLSRDFGENWTEILNDTNTAAQLFKTPYMKHENNNGQSVIHWMSDIKISPNDNKSAYINTGTGIFRTKTLGESVTIWEDFSKGVEETVHLNIYSPPAGKVRCIDVVGDLGGFSFTDINKECDFTFRDENGNRYITAINADFAESNPDIAVISPRGNWIGTSKGGAAISLDGGINWKQLSNPYGISDHADSLLEKISQPNVNPGWVAISCNGNTIIRQIADGKVLPAECTAVTFDYGKTWSQISFFNSDGTKITDKSLCVKIFSDRNENNIFYAFGSNSEVFLSTNNGVDFNECMISGELPSADFSSIEEHTAPDIRVSPFCAGEILLFFANKGMFMLSLVNNSFISRRVIPEANCSAAFCGGFGKGGVIFFCGTYNGVYGFWRSFNDNWIRINTDDTQFGQIRSICGDPRAYGRFYIATGSFGGIYGEIDI